MAETPSADAGMSCYTRYFATMPLKNKPTLDIYQELTILRYLRLYKTNPPTRYAATCGRGSAQPLCAG
jgi:hypothetical protein